MFHKPGWTLPNGHTVRSQVEANLCAYYTPGPLPHRHGTPEVDSFNVSIGPKRRALFVPSLVFPVPPCPPAPPRLEIAEPLDAVHLIPPRPTPRLVVVEPLDSISPGGGLRRLIGLRELHPTELFVVVVARRALHRHIPTGAYDLLVPLEDFSALDHYLATIA